MSKSLKRNGYKSPSHQLFKDRAKNRVDDLQMMFSNLQSARKESRTVDASVLEEQVHQMLREWKSELNDPSPASSLRSDSCGTFSADINRLLHLCDEEDDATSPFALSAPKPVPGAQNVQARSAIVSQEGLDVKHGPKEQDFPSVDQCKESSEFQQMDLPAQLDSNQFNMHLDLEHHYPDGYAGIGVDTSNVISEFLPNISRKPSDFLGPLCALWDCFQPAVGSDWWQDYCSDKHATIGLIEGLSGMTPILRLGGISFKDCVFFGALSAKVLGKEVGIPECEGAATTKSPWNAPELFDLLVGENVTIREWLFFDKPRRAFERGNRKQRSLPDYNGRGWHESRKIVMNDFNGVKRSYYMDPQPLTNFEWHLYEYEINKCDACALYRLEFKFVEGKKTPRSKTAIDSVSELQRKMGRLTAEFPLDNKRPQKGGAKFNGKGSLGNLSAPNRLASPDEKSDFGVVAAPYGDLVPNLGEYSLK